MRKLKYVFLREYTTRVYKRSFIIISIIGPLVFFLITLLPGYLNKYFNEENMTVAIVDKSSIIFKQLKSVDKNIIFKEETTQTSNYSTLFVHNNYSAIVIIPSIDSINTSPIKFITEKQPSIYLINHVEGLIETVLINKSLRKYSINNFDEIVDSVKHSVNVSVIKLDKKESRMINPKITSSISMIIGVSIYLFIMLFSTQVMRGIYEEKSNRIMEVIVTSISPLKFMVGKICGIAAVGLTQLFSWIVLIIGFSSFLSFLSSKPDLKIVGGIDPKQIEGFTTFINSINFETIIPCFIFFFIAGYLLYSSLYAIAGTLSYNGEQISQLSSIITLPFIFSLFVLSSTNNNPDSSLSFWFSMIPFTSPVVMMGRIAHGVPYYEIVISGLILVSTLIFTTWISAKIYRTTILLYGKKITLPEVIKWFKKS